MSALIKKGVQCADYDRDGLCDSLEQNSNGQFDWKLKDTNNDGYSDLVVNLAGFSVQEESKIKTCSMIGQDTDNDGLYDCEENTTFLRTDPTKLDTDADGVPDGLEIRFGLNPLDPMDAMQDPDGDGLTNINEIKANTNPFEYNTDDINNIAFKTDIIVRKDNKLDIAVANIKLADVPNGNLIEFYFIERNKLTQINELKKAKVVIPRSQNMGELLTYEYIKIKE